MKKTSALLCGLLILTGCAAPQVEPSAPTPPATAITDPAHLFSADDLKAITAAASVYLEGPEVIFSLTAIDHDAVRVNIGMYYGPTCSHGMKFTLHRTKAGWVEDRKDSTELWNQ